MFKPPKSKKLFHPDGRPYTKMDYYRHKLYGKVDNKLLSTTVANRAAGVDITQDNVKLDVSMIAAAAAAEKRN